MRLGRRILPPTAHARYGDELLDELHALAEDRRLVAPDHLRPRRDPNGQEVVLGCVMRVRLSARIESVHGDRVRVVPHLSDTQHSGFVPELPTLPPGQREVRFQEVLDQT